MPTKPCNATHQMRLREMLSIPSAPFAEHLVITYLRRYGRQHKQLKLKTDPAGNLLVHLRQGAPRVSRPICITAHLDHPGFVADRMTGRNRLRAFWRGGVPVELFAGAAVRFWAEDQWIRGRIRSVISKQRNGVKRVDTAAIEIRSPIPSGAVGMWDLPDPAFRNGRLYARNCDDMAGAAAMICCIDELIRRRRICDAYFLFTRAEEVGFIGAIAASRRKTIPRKCLVVAMECSSELPHARMGDGPILRVGDRASAFFPAATAYCHMIARQLAARNPLFAYQRKLMDGGTCESSAYCLLGYEATGLCLALGNYHNVDAKRRSIAPEYINLNDFENAVKWFVELAGARVPYTGRDETLNKQILDLERTYERLLNSSANQNAAGSSIPSDNGRPSSRLS